MTKNTRLTAILLLLVMLSALLTLPISAAYPKATDNIADEMKVLTESTIHQLKKTNATLLSTTGTEVAVCIVKTTAAGLVAGWVYRALSKKSVWLAVFVAAALVPTVNTGVFVVGCFLIYSTISEFAAGAGYSAVYFILIICAGINYLLELAINLIFSPALERLVRLLSKKVGRRR